MAVYRIRDICCRRTKRASPGPHLGLDSAGPGDNPRMTRGIPTWTTTLVKFDHRCGMSTGREVLVIGVSAVPVMTRAHTLRDSTRLVQRKAGHVPETY